MGRPEQGLKRSDDALITLASGRPYSQMFLLGMRLLGGYWLGDLEEVEGSARRMLGICAMQAMPMWRLFAEAFLVWVLVRKGRRSVPWAMQRLRLLGRQMEPVSGLAAVLTFRLLLDLKAGHSTSRKAASARHRYYHLLRRWQCFVLEVALPLNRPTATRSSPSKIKPAKTPRAFAKACR